jgi:molybdenum cofactor cytidylyltransferase
VLFTLVDHPSVAPATIGALLAASGPVLRVPRHAGRRGHPIWFARDLIPEFLAIPDTGAARDVVRAHAQQTEYLDLDDPGILADIDDPAAYGKLTGATL